MAVRSPEARSPENMPLCVGGSSDQHAFLRGSLVNAGAAEKGFSHCALPPGAG